MTRAIILAATAASLICLWVDRPKPVKAVKVDYCQVGSTFLPCTGLKYTLNI